MKIKEKPKAKKVKARAYHAWLVNEKVKSSGRLGQMNKSNKKAKRPSEFIQMAKAIEEKEARHGRF